MSWIVKLQILGKFSGRALHLLGLSYYPPVKKTLLYKIGQIVMGKQGKQSQQGMTEFLICKQSCHWLLGMASSDSFKVLWGFREEFSVLTSWLAFS